MLFRSACFAVRITSYPDWIFPSRPTGVRDAIASRLITSTLATPQNSARRFIHSNRKCDRATGSIAARHGHAQTNRGKERFVRAETESCARRRPLRATEQRRRAMLRVNALTDNLRARSRACCTARRRRLGGGAWTILPDIRRVVAVHLVVEAGTPTKRAFPVTGIGAVDAWNGLEGCTDDS